LKNNINDKFSSLLSSPEKSGSPTTGSNVKDSAQHLKILVVDDHSTHLHEEKNASKNFSSLDQALDNFYNGRNGKGHKNLAGKKLHEKDKCIRSYSETSGTSGFNSLESKSINDMKIGKANQSCNLRFGPKQRKNKVSAVAVNRNRPKTFTANNTDIDKSFYHETFKFDNLSDDEMMKHELFVASLPKMQHSRLSISRLSHKKANQTNQIHIDHSKVDQSKVAAQTIENNRSASPTNSLDEAYQSLSLDITDVTPNIQEPIKKTILNKLCKPDSRIPVSTYTRPSCEDNLDDEIRKISSIENTLELDICQSIDVDLDHDDHFHPNMDMDRSQRPNTQEPRSSVFSISKTKSIISKKQPGIMHNKSKLDRTQSDNSEIAAERLKKRQNSSKMFCKIKCAINPCRPSLPDKEQMAYYHYNESKERENAENFQNFQNHVAPKLPIKKSTSQSSTSPGLCYTSSSRKKIDNGNVNSYPVVDSKLVLGQSFQRRSGQIANYV